jgi:hypothetical protein
VPITLLRICDGTPQLTPRTITTLFQLDLWYDVSSTRDLLSYNGFVLNKFRKTNTYKPKIIPKYMTITTIPYRSVQESYAVAQASAAAAVENDIRRKTAQDRREKAHKRKYATQPAVTPPRNLDKDTGRLVDFRA